MNRRALGGRFCRFVVVASVIVACAAGGTASAQAGGRSPDLPPPSRAALARIFDPQLEKLGLRTTRARLQNLTSYRRDSEGKHLAFYVEPIESMTDAEYVANITKVAKIFLPRVFKEWTDLESFDVCQEPVPGVDDRESPPPVTQLLVSRKGLTRVRWTKVSLQDLLEAGQVPPGSPPTSTRDFFVFVNHDIAEQPAYQAALAAAVAPTTTSPAS